MHDSQSYFCIFYNFQPCFVPLLTTFDTLHSFNSLKISNNITIHLFSLIRFLTHKFSFRFHIDFCDLNFYKIPFQSRSTPNPHSSNNMILRFYSRQTQKAKYLLGLPFPFQISTTSLDHGQSFADRTSLPFDHTKHLCL